MFRFERLTVWQKAIEIFELVSLSIICHRRKFFSDDQHRDVYSRAEEIVRMLTALKKRPTSAAPILNARHSALGTRH